MNCKQGDLAFIKKALRTTNIGKIVTCKELLGKFKSGESYMWNGEMFFSPDDDYIWVISSPSSGIETLYGKSKEATIPDSWLTPIKADPTELTEETKELDYV